MGDIDRVRVLGKLIMSFLKMTIITVRIAIGTFFKIIQFFMPVVGDSGVGKTALTNLICHGAGLSNPG